MKTAVSADGTAIAWYDFGGNGPDVLLGHATGFCGRMWEPVVEHLRSHFRCVAYDVRGHGMSERPGDRPGAWHWQRFADDATAVIEAANLERPFGVGHSSGGATELLVEQRNRGTFAALYLFEPVIFAVDPPQGPMPERELAVRTRKRRPSFSSRAEALENFRDRGPFTALHPAALDAYIEHGFATLADGSVELRCRPDDEAEVYVMASDHDGYVRLPDVRCPVTVARGELSESFTAEEMRAVVARLPSGTFMEFEGVGHFGPLEQPRRFAETVIQFCDNPQNVTPGR